MKKSIGLLFSVLMSLTMVTMAWADGHMKGDAEAGKANFAVCVACHMPDGSGNAALHSPKISGQEDWYLTQQLNNFKKGIRGTHDLDIWGKTMRPMAMTLATDEIMANVVAYITTLEAPAPAPTIQGGDAVKGKALYGTCVSCHGENAEGNSLLHAPALKGQHDWYLVTQLKNFQQGARGAHPDDTWGATMAPMSKTLADEQAIKDVVAYIMSL